MKTKPKTFWIGRDRKKALYPYNILTEKSKLIDDVWVFIAYDFCDKKFEKITGIKLKPGKKKKFKLIEVK